MTSAEDINSALDEFKNLVLNGEIDEATEKMSEITDLYDISEDRNSDLQRSGISRDDVGTDNNRVIDEEGEVNESVVDGLESYNRHVGAGVASATNRVAVSSSLLSIVLSPDRFTDGEVIKTVDDLKVRVEETEDIVEGFGEEAEKKRKETGYEVPPTTTVESLSLDKEPLRSDEEAEISGTIKNIGESVVKNASVELISDDGVNLSKNKFQIGDIQPDSKQIISSIVVAVETGSHTVSLDVNAENTRTASRSLSVVVEETEDVPGDENDERRRGLSRGDQERPDRRRDRSRGEKSDRDTRRDRGRGGRGRGGGR